MKEKQFNRVVEDGLPIHHDMKGKRRQNHMNQAENWETAEVIYTKMKVPYLIRTTERD